ncbi:MAG: S16 family serine protease [Nanoarchaeota archaeon]|nr:S16 family serine protease [Nanoarchaeota archaeon]
MKKMWWFLLLVLLLSSSALAQKQYTLKLLAVQENPNGTLSGSGADLYLELKEGSGRVFLDTFPVPKMDTQISTRFAKEIACHQYKLPCQKYDFIYTIKAQTNIIGGPSAGAAIAALTTIAVLDLDYHNGDTAITGTINSGGIVGPVGGTKEKIEAASHLGLTKVLIAEGTAVPLPETNTDRSNQSNSNNTSVQKYLNLTQYAAENLNIEVVEVSDLDEVVFHLTGKNLNQKEIKVEEDKEYTQIMSDLRDLLCTRAEKIEFELYQEGLRLDENVSQRIEEQKAKADNATLQKDYYSAASYCFTASIALRSHYYNQKKLTLSKLWDKFLRLEDRVRSLEQNVSLQKIETITDLQTLIIVKDRLNDVKEQLAQFKEMPRDTEKKEEAYGILSYSEERYFSAVAWTQFFSMPGKKLVLDKEHLQRSCLQKIQEAEEREQYIGLFIGESNVGAIAKKIAAAKDASQKNEYELCLMKAIQAKGDANAVLSTLGLGKDELADVLQSKMTAVKRVIAENTAEGKFPILGYSYYQYATSLKEQEPVTSLFYLEYALEMSDLGIYFPEEKTFTQQLSDKLTINYDRLQGFILGVLVMLVLSQIKLQKIKKYWKRLRR